MPSPPAFWHFDHDHDHQPSPLDIIRCYLEVLLYSKELAIALPGGKVYRASERARAWATTQRKSRDRPGNEARFEKSGMT